MTTQHVISNVVSTPSLTVPNAIRKRKVKFAVFLFRIFFEMFKFGCFGCIFVSAILGSIEHSRASFSSLYKWGYVL